MFLYWLVLFGIEGQCLTFMTGGLGVLKRVRAERDEELEASDEADEYEEYEGRDGDQSGEL